MTSHQTSLSWLSFWHHLHAIGLTWHCPHPPGVESPQTRHCVCCLYMHAVTSFANSPNVFMTLVCQLLKGSNYWCKHMQVHTTKVSINNYYGVTVHRGCVHSLRLMCACTCIVIHIKYHNVSSKRAPFILAQAPALVCACLSPTAPTAPAGLLTRTLQVDRALRLHRLIGALEPPL